MPVLQGGLSPAVIIDGGNALFCPHYGRQLCITTPLPTATVLYRSTRVLLALVETGTHGRFVSCGDGVGKELQERPDNTINSKGLVLRSPSLARPSRVARAPSGN